MKVKFIFIALPNVACSFLPNVRVCDSAGEVNFIIIPPAWGWANMSLLPDSGSFWSRFQEKLESKHAVDKDEKEHSDWVSFSERMARIEEGKR